MKYFIMSVLFIVISMCSFRSADALDIPENLLISIIELEGGEAFLEAVNEKIKLLEKAVLQIEADQAEINQLRTLRDQLRQDIWDNEQATQTLENELLQSKIGTDTGLYAGIVIGYPLLTAMAIIEYRFPRWSPMIAGGYSSRAFIGAGFNIKVGK